MNERTINVNAEWYETVTAELKAKDNRIAELEAKYDALVIDAAEDVEATHASWQPAYEQLEAKHAALEDGFRELDGEILEAMIKWLKLGSIQADTLNWVLGKLRRLLGKVSGDEPVSYQGVPLEFAERYAADAKDPQKQAKSRILTRQGE